MRIVFFGTSDVGVPILQALHETHEIIHVVTSPDAKVGRKQIITPSPIASLASELTIPISKPEKVKNNPEFIEFLRTLAADIFVVVSYGKILPKELLEIPPFKTVNVHFSLLPKYRGPAPIQGALLAGETRTGTTLFVLDEQVDHGPVIAMESIDIDPDDTFSTLAKKLSDISASLILDVLKKYTSGEIVPQEQDHTVATKTKMISKEDGKIDWTKSHQEIYNQFRAYTPWPGIWTTYRGEILKIITCNLNRSEEEPRLEITQVQLAGKNKMTMEDFLHGHPDFKIPYLN